MNGDLIGSLLPLFVLAIAGVWIYTIISAITNDFKKDVNKIIWVALLIFIPISFILYLMMKKDLLVSKDKQTNEE